MTRIMSCSIISGVLFFLPQAASCASFQELGAQVVRDSMTVSLDEYGGTDLRLIIRLVDTDPGEGFGPLTRAADMISFSFRSKVEEQTVSIGSFSLGAMLELRSVVAKDFDKNGWLDVYAMSGTGAAGGANAAVGAIFEISRDSTNNQWQVQEVLYFNTWPRIEEDGERFGLTSYSAAFSGSHASMTRFTSVWLKPRIGVSGYYVANSELLDILEPTIIEEKQKLETRLTSFRENPSSKTATDLAWVANEYLAALIATHNENRCIEWLESFRETFEAMKMYYDHFIYNDMDVIIADTKESILRYRHPDLTRRH
ncbi:hypothetical protein ACFL44_02125 [Gemmatimonadota bacterium]